MEEPNETPNNKKTEILQPLLLACMLALGIIFGYKMNDKSERLITAIDSDEEIKIGRVEEVLRLLESRYIDTINSNDLMNVAIESMMGKLDPHSLYIANNQVSDINENMEGHFRGIGIEYLGVSDTAVITRISKGSPAEKAGLQQFDKILAINDTSYAGEKDVTDKIRAAVQSSGGSVKVELKRLNQSQTLIKQIKLDKIEVSSANLAYMLNKKMGYIKIEQFSEDTYREFMTSLERLYEKEGMRNLVIDLRGNTGGYLTQATKILNQLIKEKEQLLVYTIGRNGKREDYFTNGKTFFPELDKIAVLVDEFSASGSEVIAGAIQDNDRGIIIGRKTFGKGLVQEQYNLNDGSALRLTTAKYYNPSGRNIQKPMKDHEQYEAEVFKRSFSGKIVKRDSTDKVYKTLLLGRKVYGGNGIDPEVYIPQDTALFHLNMTSIPGEVRMFLIKEILRGRLNLNIKFDEAKLVSDYLKTATKKISPSTFAKVINEELANLKSNDPSIVSKDKSLNDPYIKSALEYLSGKILLK
jgi:carboxyl-terminal processing protease